VSTTINGFALLHTVPDNAAPAMRANWGELMDSTLEAVEGMCQSILNDLERLVVLVPTGFALSHICTPSSGRTLNANPHVRISL
jgi:hypothetical protein